jgi:hypothetical protein
MTSVNQSPTFLPNVSPSSLGGNASAYQEKMNGGAQRGGQGYGYEGKMITPGVAEVSSYKGGKRNSRRQSKRNSKRRNSKRQNKSRRQRKY